MGALDLCAPVCVVRSDARGRRDSFAAPVGVDYRGHGRGALRRDGVQPVGRCFHRRRESAHQHARLACGPSVSGFCGYVCSRFQRDLYFCREPAEPAGIVAFAGGAGGASALLLHETGDALVASGAGIRTGHCAFGRLDCGARLARSAHPAAHCGRDILGGRLRRSLCLPGFRFRSPSRTALHSTIRRYSCRALDCARLSSAHGRASHRIC